MKKKIDFGKIDYNGSGRKNCRVTLDIELKEGREGKVLSICGNIWNPRETDIYSGGQNLKEISKYIHTELFNKIFAIWQNHHLNDLHAGCEHQRALGWETDGYEKHPSEKCPTCGYAFGTAWNFEPLPKEVVEFVESICREK